MNSVEMTVTHSGADLSIMGLFWAADPFVKLVMPPCVGIGLVLGHSGGKDHDN